MAAAQTGLATLPDWGSYGKSYVGLYHLLDKGNNYAINFPVSVHISTLGTRHKGKIQDSLSHDQLYYCDRYDPSGNYWRLVYPLDKFGSAGTLYLEFVKYSTTQYFIYATATNSSAADFDVEISLMCSADAAMRSYNAGFIQQYTYNAGSDYIGINWTSQTTKWAVMTTDDSWIPQDIRDADFTNGLSSVVTPYVGDGLGRTARGKVIWTVTPNETSSRVLAVAIAADEATAATNSNAIIPGYSSVLTAARAQYLVNRSPLCTQATYGSLAERVLAETLHFIRYVNVDGAGTYKLIFRPGSSYSLANNTYYFWDCGFTALALAEAGYMGIAKDALNYPFGTDGSYLANTNPPVWAYTVWRMYQISGDRSILSSYYAALKARYDNAKTFEQTNGYIKWGDNTGGGMDNLPIWTSVTGGTNYNVSPDATAMYIWYATMLQNMAAIVSTGDVSGYATDISGWMTKLETMWYSTDGYYWALNSNASYVPVKIRTVSSLLALLAPGLSSSRVATLAEKFRADLNSNGDVLSVSPSAAGGSFTNVTWAGPSWNATNLLVAYGFRQNGDEQTARYIEAGVLSNWLDNDSDNFREYRQSTGSFAGTSHFVSFTAALLTMARRQIKRRLV